MAIHPMLFCGALRSAGSPAKLRLNTLRRRFGYPTSLGVNRLHQLIK
jgi:hypothetical protein